MYLSRLKITNFRSIKEIDLTFTSGKNVIVGRNNAGKSNIIRALNIVLGENSPTYDKSDNVTQNDFYCWKEQAEGIETIKTADEIYIWAELHREPGEPLNYDEMYKAFGFYVYSQVVQQGYPRTYAPIRLPHGSIPQEPDLIFEPDENQNAEKEYVNPKLRNQRTLEAKFENMNRFGFAFRARKLEDGTISKEMRFLYRENEESNWVMSFRTPYRNEFLQSAIIPSFRDPAGQLRLTSWSWYGKLIRKLTSGYEKDETLRNAMASVATVANTIFQEINEAVTQSTLQVAFPGTKVDFQFNAETKDDLYKSTLIYVDDGFKSQLIEKGSGIQSATIIGLFNYYTRHVNVVTSALLCIEEPELYLHPHARRVISDRLDEFLDGAKNQVVMTTHSTEFIRTTKEDLNLILVQRAGQGSNSKSINIGKFKDILVDSNQNELFFSDKVIICENLDAYVLRIIASSLFPGELDARNISIISAGGKNRISALAEMILDLGIPAYVMTDFDYFLRDSDAKRETYGAKAHHSVINLGEKYFSSPMVLGDRGATLYKEIQKAREKIKDDHQSEFYTAKRADQIPIDLTNILSELRQNGVCILRGEIENLCLDEEFLNPNKKISLTKVFDLNTRLSAGEPITSIFDTDEISEFLEAVFKK